MNLVSYKLFVLVSSTVWMLCSATNNHTHRLQQDGFLLEKLDVRTEDGFILGLYHIVGRVNENSKSNILQRPPVLLLHGLLCSSFDWIMLGENRSLPYMLYDAGYDVWLGNSRGNTYSRNHLHYLPKDRAFWDFSWHEMGQYDLPAMIDYILHKTGQEKLFYIGHSQGAVAFYVMASFVPEYNDKVITMYGLGSGGFLSNMKSPFAKILADQSDELKKFSNRIHLYQIVASPRVLNDSDIDIGNICSDDSAMQDLCATLIYLIGGFNTDQFNKSFIPKLSLKTSAGASLKQVEHFLQIYKSEKFCMFDYGKELNNVLYRQDEPFDYPLEKITTPVYLFYGSNDWLVSEKDVKKLATKISNCAGLFHIPHPRFTHLDFIYGEDADGYLYKPILELMGKDVEKLIN